MYRATVRDGARIDWQCRRCQDDHSDLFGDTRAETHETFFEVHELQPGSDMSDPIGESTSEYQTRDRRIIPRRVRYVTFTQVF